MAVDEQKVEEAVGKVFGELGVAITGPLIVLGDRLGLWAAMAGAGPVMPGELAARTGTVERYARIGYAISTLVCTPSSLAQPGAAALGAMAGEARLRQVLAEAGYTRVRRVAQQAAPFNIVLEARP